MADASTIAEFLVAIGFKVDESAQKRAQAGLKDTGNLAAKLNQQFAALGKAFNDLGKSMSEAAGEPARKFAEGGRKIEDTTVRLRKSLVDLGTVAIATTTGFVAAMRQVGKQYEELYYLTQRTGASAQGLSALSASMRAVGKEAGDAGVIIAHMQDMFRVQPGREEQLMSFAGRYMEGVKKRIGDADKATQEYFATLQFLEELEKQGPLGQAQAQTLGTLFIGPEYQLHVQNRVREEQARIREKKLLDDAGLSQEKYNELVLNGQKVTQGFADVWAHFGLIFTQSFGEVGPKLGAALKGIDDIIASILKFNALHPGASTIEALGTIAVSARVALGLLGQITGWSAASVAGSLMSSFAAIGAVAAQAIATLRANLGLKTPGVDEALSLTEGPMAGLLGLFGIKPGAPGVGATPEQMKRLNKAFGPKAPPPAAHADIPPPEELPQHQQGGIIARTGPAVVHAGEMVLPETISRGLQQMIAAMQRAGGWAREKASGVAAEMPGGTEMKRAQEKLSDWLQGAAIAPKVVIDNIDEFVRQFMEAEERARVAAKTGETVPGGAAGGAGEGGAAGGAAGAAGGAPATGGAPGAPAGGHAAGGRAGADAESSGPGEEAEGEPPPPRTAGGRAGAALGGAVGGAVGTLQRKYGEAASFEQKAPTVIANLQRDLGLTREQAAGLVGNLGAESGGLSVYHERGKAAGEGGVGWAQWTGSRRKLFEQWATEHKMDPRSDEASYGYLVHELQTPQWAGFMRNLKQTKTAAEATSTTLHQFEKPRDQSAGVEQARLGYTQRALRQPEVKPGDIPGAPPGIQPGGDLTKEQIARVHADPRLAKTADPDLHQAMKAAWAEVLPEGYTAKLTSAQRAGGTDRSQHFKGNAEDWQIFDPKGNPIANRGPDTTGLYTKAAVVGLANLMESAPDKAASFTHGRHFGTQIGGGGPADIMHYDVNYPGPRRGRIGDPNEDVPAAKALVAARAKAREAKEPAVAGKPGPSERPLEPSRNGLARIPITAPTPVEAPPVVAPAAEPAMAAARGGLIPSNIAGGIFPLLAHAGEMVLPEGLSKGLQQLLSVFGGIGGRGGGIGGMFQQLLGGLGGGGGGGVFQQLLGGAGMGGAGGMGALFGGMQQLLGGGGLDRMSDMRLGGGDTHNYGASNNVTINQTNNHQFDGSPGPMMDRLRDTQERLTGDLVRNFQSAVI